MSIFRTEKGVDLFCEYGFEEKTIAYRFSIVNGCGPGGFLAAIVPDKIKGIDVSDSCNIHDFGYEFGIDDEDKKTSDRIFLNNLIRTITALFPKPSLIAINPKWSRLRKWISERINDGRIEKNKEEFREALQTCRVYYEAVSTFGGPAFWSGKDKSPFAIKRKPV